MKTNKILKTLIILMIVCLSVGCDQVSKHIVRQRVRYNQHISVIDNCFTITKVENNGAFLSMGNSLPRVVNLILLIILPLIVIALALVYLFYKSELSNLRILGICLIIGGGLGNLYDRAVHGSVTDFLHMDFILFQTGIFNLADVSIMTGMFIILVDTFFHRKEIDYKTSEN